MSFNEETIMSKQASNGKIVKGSFNQLMETAGADEVTFASLSDIPKMEESV